MPLIIDKVNKNFAEKVILENFSYEFKDNGIYVLTGDSGTGKTTLLRMISGLDTDYTGSITGAGIGNVAFAFQEYRLFPQLTAIENVIFANSDTKTEAVVEKARNMLNNLGISENDFDLLPHELSGGMKQRVSLARAFVNNSPVLLLDEPTKELDRENAAAVINEIKKQSLNRLVIMVSHNSDDAKELNAVKIPIK